MASSDNTESSAGREQPNILLSAPMVSHLNTSITYSGFPLCCSSYSVKATAF